MIKSAQILAVPLRMIELGMIDIKKQALFYDKICVVHFDDENDKPEDVIGYNDLNFLTSNKIIFNKSIRRIMTDDPPVDSGEIEVALTAAMKIGFICEHLEIDAQKVAYFRKMNIQAISQLGCLDMRASLTNSEVVSVDFGERWLVDLPKDREFDNFEEKRYKRSFKVDPPLNSWNHYQDIFNSSVYDKYSSAINILIEDIDVPEYHTNWEDIIRFRESRNNDILLYRLRKRLADISDSTDMHDLAMEIRSERDSFNSKLISMNNMAKISFVKATLSFAVGLLPNLIKLKWGEIVEKGVGIIETKFSATNAMMNMKNDGLYYITQIQNDFA